MKHELASKCRWAGTVVTALWLAIWMGSARWTCDAGLGRSYAVSLRSGRLWVLWDEPARLPTAEAWWEWQVNPQKVQWAFAGRRTQWHLGRYGYVVIPFWSLLLLGGVPTGWLWYRDRPRSPGLCSRCGYDLRGARHAVCPECGAVVARVGV